MSVMTRSQAAAAALRAQRHPKADETFRLGLESVFRQWTALNLAISHGWGGPQSQQKANILLEDIMRTFQGPERLYKDDIALILEDSMHTDFNTLLEDGSAEEVGELLVNMWRLCAGGDFSLVETVMSKESRVVDVLSQSRGLDRGDEMDSDDENEGLDVADAVASSIEHPSSAEMEESMDLPLPDSLPTDSSDRSRMYDEDGWEIAGKRRTRRK